MRYLLIILTLLLTGCDMSPKILTIVVDGELLERGGTVVLITNPIDADAFKEQYADRIEKRDGELQWRVKATGVVSFVEVQTPPNFEYRFRTATGEGVRSKRLTVGSTAGLIKQEVAGMKTIYGLYNHLIDGPEADVEISRGVSTSDFPSLAKHCEYYPAVLVCYGTEREYREVLLRTQRARTVE